MEPDLQRLNDEMELFDFDKSSREMITNVYSSWKKCLDNQIIISDLKNVVIRIDDRLHIDGVETHRDISQKSTLLFSACENVNILVLNKVNHVIVERSHDVNLKSVAGIIGGIDVLHSTNVNLLVTKRDIFYMGFGTATRCNAYIEEPLTLNTLISTLECSNINFISMIDNLSVLGKYVTNRTLFNGFNLYMFIANATTGILELHYLAQLSGSKGIIYPVP